MGTYANPITFATDVNELGWCQIIYVPYMKRYFIHEDECSECDAQLERLAPLPLRHVGRGRGSVASPSPERRRCGPVRARGPVPTRWPIRTTRPSWSIRRRTCPVTTAPIFSGPTTCWTPIAVTNPGKQTSAPGRAVGLHVQAVDTSPVETLAYREVGLPAGLVDQRIDRPDLGRSDAERPLEGHRHRVRHLRLAIART